MLEVPNPKGHRGKSAQVWSLELSQRLRDFDSAADTLGMHAFFLPLISSALLLDYSQAQSSGIQKSMSLKYTFLRSSR